MPFSYPYCRWGNGGLRRPEVCLRLQKLGRAILFIPLSPLEPKGILPEKRPPVPGRPERESPGLHDDSVLGRDAHTEASLARKHSLFRVRKCLLRRGDTLKLIRGLANEDGAPRNA